MENGKWREDESYGVLLYYKYTSIPDVVSLARFYDEHCRSLDLLGRIRVGPDGVNATIGGKLSALEEHIAIMRSNSLFSDTDFKLAPCSHPSDGKIARECGFTSLSVRIVKELVTFTSDPLVKSPEISNAGRHLSAAEFHQVLHESGNALECHTPMQNEEIVLLDARNVYETRIGKFKMANLDTLDPEIRQYSDLAAWIDKHSERLRNKKVLMYCTGGIRCEMASAYIRSKGADFENVFQDRSTGKKIGLVREDRFYHLETSIIWRIQRYLEQFPDGGYFKGKNFVFDHRIYVGSQDIDVLGTCLICGCAFDDYSSRCRCALCRMLVLVCHSCQDNFCETYVCELCQKHGNGQKPNLLMKNHQLRLELLPELLHATENESEILHTPRCELSRRYAFDHRQKLRILCLHGFRQSASSFKGRTSSLAKKLKNIVEFFFIDAPHELPFIYQPTESCSQQNFLPPLVKFRRRSAWLISPYSALLDESSGIAAEQKFDPLQYQMQTEGFEESFCYLQDVISRMGPFDGILGFSQGAAMAALFCEQRQRRDSASDFQFAVLCSGFFAVSCNSVKGFIKCPSLHVYGGGRGSDRQIHHEASRELAELFDQKSSVTIEHDLGHIIPTKSPYIDQMKAFLMDFL